MKCRGRLYSVVNSIIQSMLYARGPRVYKTVTYIICIGSIICIKLPGRSMQVEWLHRDMGEPAYLLFAMLQVHTRPLAEVLYRLTT